MLVYNHSLTPLKLNHGQLLGVIEPTGEDQVINKCFAVALRNVITQQLNVIPTPVPTASRDVIELSKSAGQATTATRTSAAPRDVIKLSKPCGRATAGDVTEPSSPRCAERLTVTTTAIDPPPHPSTLHVVEYLASHTQLMRRS